MDKLTEIMEHKRQELAARIRPVQARELERHGSLRHGRLSFADALGRGHLSVIAEIKRASPSAGWIKEGASAPEQARKYLNAGVDCLSVLTDEKFFHGKLADLWEVTDFVREHGRETPALRKDFFVHPLQVLEAAEAGAGAILVIVRVLSDDEIKALCEAAALAGLDALFEVHDEAELERALRHDPAILGVNNRDLGTFTTDLAVSERLFPQMPGGVLKVSESGIFTAEDAARVAEAGGDAILVGQALMQQEDPEPLVHAFQSCR